MTDVTNQENPDLPNQRQVGPGAADLRPAGYVPAQPAGPKSSANRRAAARKGASQAGASGSAAGMAQYSRNSANYVGRTQNKGRGKGIAIALILVLAFVGVGGAAFYIYKETQKAIINDDLHKMSDAEMEAVDSELTGNMGFDEPFTILLLGSDARADDPDMGARTDTNIVVRVDTSTNTISMVSIPRDTMVYIDGVGAQKFNAAYTYGGASGTISAVKNLCGVEIDHFAAINFEGLVDLIDAIGGIDVHVDEEIDDWEAGDIVVPAGDVHLNGEGALILARSRAYADGDYTRQANQRKVIMAIVNKGLSAPATDLTGLIQASTKFLTTDSGITVDFIKSVAEQIRHNNDYPLTIYAATIPSTTAMIGDVSYVIADRAGTAEMMQLFSAGRDVSEPLETSSMAEDLAAAESGYAF